MIAHLLLSSLLLAQTYIVPGRPRAAAAGCNEFTDDFSGADISSWTVPADSHTYSLDATNDELDYNSTGTGSYRLAIKETATSGNDNAVKYTAVDGDSDFGIGLVVRAPDYDLTTGESALIVYEFSGTVSAGVFDASANTNVVSLNCNLSGTYSHSVTDGEVLAASVSGSGASTVIKFWVNPDAGDCPSDWGTADYTWSGDCGSCCLDSGSYVGIEARASGTQVFTFDDFVGADN